MRLFLDSSAMVKRYIRELGTDGVISHCQKAEEIILSVLCFPEVISAFNRVLREQKISKQDYLDFKKELAADLEQTTIMDFSSPIFEKTVLFLEQASLRTLDAIQLASALDSNCDLFISADKRQIKAAKLFELKAELIPS